MGTVLLAVLAGGLTLFTPPPADGGGVRVAAKKVRLSEDERIDAARN